MPTVRKRISSIFGKKSIPRTPAALEEDDKPEDAAPAAGSSDTPLPPPRIDNDDASPDARNSQREWVLKLEREAEQRTPPNGWIGTSDSSDSSSDELAATPGGGLPPRNLVPPGGGEPPRNLEPPGGGEPSRTGMSKPPMAHGVLRKRKGALFREPHRERSVSLTGALRPSKEPRTGIARACRWIRAE